MIWPMAAAPAPLGLGFSSVMAFLSSLPTLGIDRIIPQQMREAIGRRTPKAPPAERRGGVQKSLVFPKFMMALANIKIKIRAGKTRILAIRLLIHLLKPPLKASIGRASSIIWKGPIMISFIIEMYDESTRKRIFKREMAKIIQNTAPITYLPTVPAMVSATPGPSQTKAA